MTRERLSRAFTWLWWAIGACILTGTAACGGLSCESPIKDTAERVAAADFSQRANGTLLRCRGETYVYSLRVKG